MTRTENQLRVLALAAEQGITFVRFTDVVDDCHCGGVGTVAQDAAVATGLPLEFYTPAVGEVLKNHHMACSACGFEQWS